MADAKPRVKVPAEVKKGEVVEVKTLISHKMETGLRKDKKGEKIPRNIINKFVASFNGEQVFAMDIDPAIAANPYIKFSLRPEKSGELEMTWTDDDGKSYSSKKKISVN